MTNKIKKLVSVCNLQDEQELINAALTLFKWAVEERKLGRDIASYNEKEDFLEVIKLPALENINV